MLSPAIDDNSFSITVVDYGAYSVAEVQYKWHKTTRCIYKPRRLEVLCIIEYFKTKVSNFNFEDTFRWLLEAFPHFHSDLRYYIICFKCLTVSRYRLSQICQNDFEDSSCVNCSSQLVKTLQ